MRFGDVLFDDTGLRGDVIHGGDGEEWSVGSVSAGLKVSLAGLQVLEGKKQKIDINYVLIGKVLLGTILWCLTYFFTHYI